MNRAARKSWSPPNFSRLLLSSSRAATSILLIALGAVAFRTSAEDVGLPDYFASARAESPSPSPAESDQEPTEITERDAEGVIALADDALHQLADGNTSAAFSFASLFDTSVDYYDEGEQTPNQIAQEKANIFGNYQNYSTEPVGNPTLDETDRPDVKWVNFTYRYEITKKSGAILRGVAEARWELRKVGDKIFVIATRETTRRQ